MLDPGAIGLKMPLAGFFLGIILLTMGRRLFWLFVGVVGFIFSFHLVLRLLPHLSHSTALAIALVIGLAGALLAVSLQKIAIAAGGFLAGGHLLPQIMKMAGMTHQHHWALFIIGGIAGAVLMSLAFGFALIVLSSLIGADLVLQALHIGGRRFSPILFVLIAAAGFLFQSGLIKPGRSGNRARN